MNTLASTRFPTITPEALARFLGSLGAQGFAGANVTLPHKEAALRLAAVADEAAAHLAREAAR